MPATVGLSIFMGLEIHTIKDLMLTGRPLLRKLSMVLFVTSLVIFVGVNITNTYFYSKRFADNSSFIQTFFKHMSESVPQNGLVLYNFVDNDSTIEYIEETKMQLNILYDRSDIRVEYLDLDKFPSGDYMIFGLPLVTEKYTRKLIEDKLIGYKMFETWALENDYPILTTSARLPAQIAKNIYKLTFKNIPLTGDGIFARYLVKNMWYEYWVK